MTMNAVSDAELIERLRGYVECCPPGFEQEHHADMIRAADRLDALTQAPVVSDEMVERAAATMWTDIHYNWEYATKCPESSHYGHQVAYLRQRARSALEAALQTEQAGESALAEFGHGKWVVDTGHHYGVPSVFIGPSPEPGPIGELAKPDHQLPNGRLKEREFFLTFPTDEQARRVADALVGATPTPQPASGEHLEVVAWIRSGALNELLKRKNIIASVSSGLLRKPFGDPVALVRLSDAERIIAEREKERGHWINETRRVLKAGQEAMDRADEANETLGRACLALPPGRGLGERGNGPVDGIKGLRTKLRRLSEALEPFISVRDQFPESVKLINKKMDGFTPVTVTVTKDQFLAARQTLSQNGEGK